MRKFSNFVSIFIVHLLVVSMLLPLSASAVDYSKQTNIALTVGTNETERNITWYFNGSEAGRVQFAQKKGEEFPLTYSEVVATVSAVSENNVYAHKATLKGLTANTEYVYRLVNGSTVSNAFSFKTDKTDNFNFIFVGDPQIGADDLTKDAESWNKTLTTALNMFPNSNLLVSAGDQVDNAISEEEYNSLLEPTALRSLAFAPTIGNHDSWSGLFSEHFFLPNTAIGNKNYGVTEAGSDYWYTYGEVLFLHINSNSMETAEHKDFMSKAIKANPNVNWKIVVMHHSIYSAAGHASQEDVLKRREELSPVFDELDIDVVLMGHDHVYVRSYMMNVTKPEKTYGVLPSVFNPDGILYITAGSSSGSKYYELVSNAESKHAAVKIQGKTPTFSNVEIEKDYFAITTYNANDKSVIDKFEIYKGDSFPTNHTHSLITIERKRATCTVEGVITHWKCNICDAKFSDASGKNKIEDTTIEKLEHSYVITVSGRTKRCGKCGHEVEIYKVSNNSVISGTSENDNTDSQDKSDEDISSDVAGVGSTDDYQGSENSDDYTELDDENINSNTDKKLVKVRKLNKGAVILLIAIVLVVAAAVTTTVILIIRKRNKK